MNATREDTALSEAAQIAVVLVLGLAVTFAILFLGCNLLLQAESLAAPVAQGERRLSEPDTGTGGTVQAVQGESFQPWSGIQPCSGICAGILHCIKTPRLESSLAPGSSAGILCQDSVLGTSIEMGSCARIQTCTRIQCWDPVPGSSAGILCQDPVPGSSLAPESSAGILSKDPTFHQDPTLHQDPVLGSCFGIQPCSRIQCWDPVLGSSHMLGSCSRIQPRIRIQCWDPVLGSSHMLGSCSRILIHSKGLEGAGHPGVTTCREGACRKGHAGPGRF
ncbi:hypothetical protein WISP_09470 [Willisornis vidua]|uniref:Uncharacterized protein n=1 Tax=Willisornis vidua TaxID=1566151 RepID=A0ABQ9DSE7_9PASS|nr:hypothetical protein WISP_09470 [Willisornis vidua]